MRILIIGCGRTGAGLAAALALRGHTVTVVDKEPGAFVRLGPAFGGRGVAGDGFDRAVLLQAGIEHADGLAALSGSDETNVVVARLARQVFKVPTVVARLYDPRRAEIYRRLGVQTVAPVNWAISYMAGLLCRSPLDSLLSLGGDVDLVEVPVPPLLTGRTVADVTIPGEIQVAALRRGDHTVLPTLGTAFRPGDRLYLVVVAAAADRLRALLGGE